MGKLEDTQDAAGVAGGGEAFRRGGRQHRQHQLQRHHPDAGQLGGVQREQGGRRAITGVLAKELGPHRIRVNAVSPGMVETEGVRAAGFDESDFRKELESRTPLGRIGQPGDIAPAVVFLAGDDAGWITGETLLIAGGLR